MTTNTNVFSDPQGSMAVLLRPPDGFEGLYQGAAQATPLPFVAGVRGGGVNDVYNKLDPMAGEPEVSAVLLRYVSVPIGATMMILIPRARYLSGGEPAEGVYTYELRWRLRTVTDHNVAQGQRSDPTVPYTLIPRRGAPEDNGDQLTAIPAYVTETIVPAAAGNSALPIVSTATNPRGAAGQGLFVPATVGGFGNAYAPNNYFPPILRRVVGNELSIVAYRTAGASTWDFQNDDGGISNVYGTNQSGAAHPVFYGVGMYLVFLAGSPAL